MKFIAVGSNRSIFVTDDYTRDEILKGIHIKNIISDFKTVNEKGISVTVYDINGCLVTRLNIA